MAENVLDSSPSSGTAGTPTPQGSSGEGGSSGSFDAAKLQSLIEGFGKRIEEIDARTKSLQGDKDRAVVKTKKEVEELKAKIAEYEKLKSKGLEPDEALDEMDFRSTVRQLQEQLKTLNSVQNSTAGNGQSQTTEAAKAVLNELKLDANAPEVTSILAKGLDPDKQELELRRFAARPRPQPSAAESTTIAASAPAGGVDVDRLNAELVQLSKSPSRNMKRIEEIGDILKKAG
jgi:hypothetical protein